MTVHFAAARRVANSPVARILSRREICPAANDNHIHNHHGDDQLLYAALRHFAEYGMRAARTARMEAENALSRGDHERYQWWLGICRALDRNMARAIEKR